MPDYACQLLVRIVKQGAVNADVGDLWVNVYVRCDSLTAAVEKRARLLREQGWISVGTDGPFMELGPAPRSNQTCELFLEASGFYVEIHSHDREGSASRR